MAVFNKIAKNMHCTPLGKFKRYFNRMSSSRDDFPHFYVSRGNALNCD